MLYQPYPLSSGRSITPARPLPGETQSHFSPLLHHDFSQVNIHTGPEAVAQSQLHRANAFTLGRDIYFNQGQYRPGQKEGQRLLAHELTHVIQHDQFQKNTPSVPENQAEQEADHAADKAVNGQPASVEGAVSPGTILKQEATETPPPTQTGPQPAIPQLTMPSLSLPQQPSLFSNPLEEFTISAFQTNSAALQTAHTEMLQTIAVNLNQNPLQFGDFVTIWGYTDSSGEEAHNRELGRQRADAVRQYLISLLSNPEAGNEIRAYSAGESFAERQGAVPEYRKVTITITRREINMARFHATSPPLGPTAISPSVRRPNLLPATLINPPQLVGPINNTQLAPGFWRAIAPASGPAVDLRRLSEVFTDGLRQDLSSGIAPLLEPLARVVGARASRSELERMLNDAFISAGEAGLRELLQMMIFSIAGQPSSRPENPYGPVIPDGLPSPTMFNSPVFTF